MFLIFWQVLHQVYGGRPRGRAPGGGFEGPRRQRQPKEGGLHPLACCSLLHLPVVTCHHANCPTMHPMMPLHPVAYHSHAVKTSASVDVGCKFLPVRLIPAIPCCRLDVWPHVVSFALTLLSLHPPPRWSSGVTRPVLTLLFVTASSSRYFVTWTVINQFIVSGPLQT